jgi:hypothetical protein
MAVNSALPTPFLGSTILSSRSFDRQRIANTGANDAHGQMPELAYPDTTSSSPVEYGPNRPDRILGLGQDHAVLARAHNFLIRQLSHDSPSFLRGLTK